MLKYVFALRRSIANNYDNIRFGLNSFGCQKVGGRIDTQISFYVLRARAYKLVAINLSGAPKSRAAKLVKCSH